MASTEARLKSAIDWWETELKVSAHRHSPSEIDVIETSLDAIRRVASGAGVVSWLPIDDYVDNGGTVLVSDGTWSWEARYDADRREWYPVNIYWTDMHGSSLVGLTMWAPMPLPPKESK